MVNFGPQKWFLGGHLLGPRLAANIIAVGTKSQWGLGLELCFGGGLFQGFTTFSSLLSNVAFTHPFRVFLLHTAHIMYIYMHI